MKEYTTPIFILLRFEVEDICTFSAPSSDANASFDGYEFDEDSWF